MTVARLYYECHVTIAPLSEANRPVIVGVAERYGFKLAEFLMQRGKDGVDRPADDPNSFLSARSTGTESYEDFRLRMMDFCNEMRAQGVEIRRYKIEDTLLDSRHDGDECGFLMTEGAS